MSFPRRTLLSAAVAGGVAAATGGCDSTGPAAPAASLPPAAPPSPAASPSPSAPGGPAALPAEVANGPRDVPAVALTFHGQGEPGVVRALLDALAAGQAKVTVLAVGTWLQQQPDLAVEVLKAGHELGNHTQTHGDISAMPAAQAFSEIDDCARALHGLTGSIGRWFRPSQTQHSTPLIQQQAARAGYSTCLSYDVDSLDHTDPGADVIVKATLRGVRNGSIISLHCGHPGTVKAVPALLTALRGRGLRPVTVSELLG